MADETTMGGGADQGTGGGDMGGAPSTGAPDAGGAPASGAAAMNGNPIAPAGSESAWTGTTMGASGVNPPAGTTRSSSCHTSSRTMCRGFTAGTRRRRVIR